MVLKTFSSFPDEHFERSVRNYKLKTRKNKVNLMLIFVIFFCFDEYCVIFPLNCGKDDTSVLVSISTPKDQRSEY